MVGLMRQGRTCMWPLGSVNLMTIIRVKVQMTGSMCCFKCPCNRILVCTWKAWVTFTLHIYRTLQTTTRQQIFFQRSPYPRTRKLNNLPNCIWKSKMGSARNNSWNRHIPVVGRKWNLQYHEKKLLCTSHQIHQMWTSLQVQLYNTSILIYE